MGYACPVCGDPQADGVHLANHVAFTAITSGGDHEDWLDEEVPGWGALSEDALAERVVEYAEDAEYPQVFEASGKGRSDHSHGRSADSDGAEGLLGAAGFSATGAGPAGGLSDEETREIVEAAHELTPERGGDEVEDEGRDEVEDEGRDEDETE